MVAQMKYQAPSRDNRPLSCTFFKRKTGWILNIGKCDLRYRISRDRFSTLFKSWQELFQTLWAMQSCSPFKIFSVMRSTVTCERSVATTKIRFHSCLTCLWERTEHLLLSWLVLQKWYLRKWSIYRVLSFKEERSLVTKSFRKAALNLHRRWRQS